jgi:nucleoside-diphosphate-sugar epimerase
LDENQSLAGYAANIDGVANVIEAIRSTPTVKRVTFVSSQLVCRIGYAPKHDGDYQPSTLYGQSKVISEQLVRTADEIGSATWTIVRPTSLWGPWFGVPYKQFFTAIARGHYVHPQGVTIFKQWGYVGNAAFQLWALSLASAERVHKQTFYLADYEPVDLGAFANKVQTAFGSRPIRRVPAGILKAAAVVGDVAQKLGWRAPPLTSFRYQNIVTPEIQDLDSLEEVVGPLPYTVDQGIEITIDWLKEQQRTRVRQ